MSVIDWSIENFGWSLGIPEKMRNLYINYINTCTSIKNNIHTFQDQRYLKGPHRGQTKGKANLLPAQFEADHQNETGKRDFGIL